MLRLRKLIKDSRYGLFLGILKEMSALRFVIAKNTKLMESDRDLMADTMGKLTQKAAGLESGNSKGKNNAEISKLKSQVRILQNDIQSFDVVEKQVNEQTRRVEEFVWQHVHFNETVKSAKTRLAQASLNDQPEPADPDPDEVMRGRVY